MFETPKEILDEMYNNQLQLISDTFRVPLRIKYQIQNTVVDEFAQNWAGSSTVPQTINIVCSYREEKQIGTVVSSQIIQGIPTGIFKLFIPYANKIEVENLTNYVKNSLTFIINPDSSDPITLIPESDLQSESIEYLLDDANMPLSQIWICKIQELK